MKVDLPNYKIKSDLKNVTGIDASKIAAKSDLSNIKAEIDKSDIDKLKNIPTNLSSLKSKVDKFDINKLAPVSVGLSKLSNVVKNDVVRKDVYNAKIKNIQDKIPGITNLATKTTLNAKREIGEIPGITNLATTTALTAVENKTPNVSNLVEKLTMTQKLIKLKRELLIMIMINILLLQNFIS